MGSNEWWVWDYRDAHLVHCFFDYLMRLPHSFHMGMFKKRSAVVIRLLSFFLFFYYFLFVNFGIASTIRIPVIKDNSISSVGKEQVGNNGRSTSLKLKSIQEYVLFDLDVAKLKGFLVKDAWIHFRSNSPARAPVKRAGISTLASDWIEGQSRRHAPEAGSSCFVQAEYGNQDWAYPGSTLMDVVFGRGNTIWESSEATEPDREGWQKIRIGPEILAARIAEISKGFCLYDDVGSEWDEKEEKFTYRVFPNRTIYSRENLKSAPWIEVEIAGQDFISPESVGSIRVETKALPVGEAFLVWKTPFDKGGGKTLGFDVSWTEGKRGGQFPRYLVPMAGKPDKKVMMHVQDMGFRPGEEIEVSVTSVDSAGNRSRPFVKTITLSKGLGNVNVPDSLIKPYAGSIKVPTAEKITISVTDLLDKVVPKTGRMIPEHGKGYRRVNHIFSGENKIVRLHGAGNEDICFQVTIEGKASDFSIDCLFDNEPDIKPTLYKFEYVKVKSSWGRHEMIPDPLVPAKGLKGEAINGRQSYLCEIYIPHGTATGIKKGKLVVRTGNERVEMDINLMVWNFTLPDKLSFIPEMNAYSRVSPYKGYQYYRMAHRHRTCLNRLPYGWNGLPEFAPVKTEAGFDWDLWDEKTGPLVDGSAFADLPRKNQPVDVLYLPLSENWPVLLAGNYTKSWWADQALSDGYRKDLKKGFENFAAHIREKGWNRTQFQFYLNNKVYYKKTFKQSSAPWIFDEPENIQDFMALKWYGDLWHQAVDTLKGNTDLAFRNDISYTQYGRDILWGISDIEYLGGNNHQKTRMKQDEFALCKKAQFAEYGTANKISESNLQPVLWQISAWANGASGVLPWQTIGSDKCWETGEQTALFYPKGDRVYPSVRLKAFRHGQQFVEYLELLGDALGLSDDAVRKWVVKQLAMEGSVSKTSEQDAGTIDFDRISTIDLWQLRLRIGETLHRLAQSRKTQ